MYLCFSLYDTTVQSRIKTHCCCRAYFHSKYSSSPLWLPFYQAFATASLGWPAVPQQITVSHVWFLVRQAWAWLPFPLPREKKCLWCLCWRESWFMCKLSFGLYCMPVESTHADKRPQRSRLRMCRFLGWPQWQQWVVVKDYQTRHEGLSVFICSFLCKVNPNMKNASVVTEHCILKVKVLWVFFWMFTLIALSLCRPCSVSSLSSVSCTLSFVSSNLIVVHMCCEPSVLS